MQVSGSFVNLKVICGTVRKSRGFFDQAKDLASIPAAYTRPPLFLKGALSGLRQFLTTESHLKMMKMLLISTKRLFSFSRYLSFCLDVLVI